MSSYLNIYIYNEKEDVYTYLSSYSRNSKVYETFYDALGNNIVDWKTCASCVLTRENLLAWTSSINEGINHIQNRIKEERDAINFLKETKLSKEELIEEFWEIKKTIGFLKEELEELQMALNVVCFLKNIDYCHCDKVLYAGIDGCNPSGSGEEE